MNKNENKFDRTGHSGVIRNEHRNRQKMREEIKTIFDITVKTHNTIRINSLLIKILIGMSILNLIAFLALMGP